MRLTRSLTAIFMAALMLVLLAACGGGGTSASGGGSLPLFAGAKQLEGGSPMAIAIDAAKQQLKQQSGAGTTVDAYSLPVGTTFDQVKKFYSDSLTSAGWKDAAGGAAMPAMPNGGTAVWTKNDKELFTVTVMPDPTGGSGAILLVAHATQK